jgi:hypothetical protein
VQDIEQPAVRLVELLSKAVQCDDYPVSIAAFSSSVGRSRVADDGFFGRATQRAE